MENKVLMIPSPNIHTHLTIFDESELFTDSKHRQQTAVLFTSQFIWLIWTGFCWRNANLNNIDV